MKFVKLDSSEAVDVFLNDQCQAIARRISAHPERYHFDISVRPEARKDGKVTSFVVDAVINIARQGSLRVHKHGADLRSAVAEAIDSLETQLRRYTEKRERSRKTFGRSLKSVRSERWKGVA